MKKPIIGITPAYSTVLAQYSQPIAYTRAIIEAGGVPVILPFTADKDVIADIVDTCDGFLFSGGHDVAPWVYGEDPWYKLDVLAPLRDSTETAMFKPMFESKKPIVGICRGMQLINSCLGGTLYQDLPTQYPDRDGLLKHCQTELEVTPTHKVNIVSGSPLERVLGCSTLMVNSFHHQAVKDLAPGLVVTATAPDGLIEGAYMPEHPYLCLVQWHPEELSAQCPNSKNFFKKFVGACAK